jgi:Phosphoribosyl transferase domain
MPALKGVIFSLRDVLARNGPIEKNLFNETIRLLRFLKDRGITPVFATNHNWYVKKSDGTRIRFQEALEGEIGAVPFYIAENGDMDWKPRAGAVRTILTAQCWSNREAMYVGNTEDDMKTAVNGDVLFLNALWHGEANPYGYRFQSPKDVARFVDCICLGLDDWFWALKKGDLRVYALAPFTTLSPQYVKAHDYSASARETAKHGPGDATFWGRLLAARVYFSGLVDEIDYITAYPGHSPSSKQTVVAEALSILAESLRKRYLPDLIIRHTKAQKSQTARSSGGSVGVENQLRTICINRGPRKGLKGSPYKANPMKHGKTVLVVDDFCTQGNSFEAARAFIRATGAQVVCLSWLKTINTNYNAISGEVSALVRNPYAPLTISKQVSVTPHSYGGAVVNPSAPSDLAQVYEHYFAWDWP